MRQLSAHDKWEENDEGASKKERKTRTGPKAIPAPPSWITIPAVVKEKSKGSKNPKGKGKQNQGKTANGEIAGPMGQATIGVVKPGKMEIAPSPRGQEKRGEWKEK